MNSAIFRHQQSSLWRFFGIGTKILNHRKHITIIARVRRAKRRGSPGIAIILITIVIIITITIIVINIIIGGLEE